MSHYRAVFTQGRQLRLPALLQVKRLFTWSRALWVYISYKRIPTLFDCCSNRISRNRFTLIPLCIFQSWSWTFKGLDLAFIYLFLFFFSQVIDCPSVAFRSVLFWAQLKESQPYTWRSSGWQQSSAPFLMKKETPRGVKRMERTHTGTKVTESSGIWLHKLMLAEHLEDFKARLAVFKILAPLLSLQTSQLI